MNNDNDVTESLLALFGIVFFPLVYGFTLWMLYGWFITPVFDLPNISYLQAVGITLFILAIKFNLNKNQEFDIYKSYGMYLGLAIFMLIVGAIFKVIIY